MKKVLIVEDDANLSAVLKTAFEHSGFSADQAFDGAEGFNLLATYKDKPSVILLDIMMPMLNGFEFLEKIKASDYKNIPVVALTNLSQKEDRDKMKKLGAADYLVKSQMEPHEIVDRIKQLLAK